MLAITNGKVVTITKGVIDQGTILVKDGKILEVGKDVKIPEGAKVIDAQGKIITPGLIDAHSHLAIFGEPSVWANADGNEVSDPITAEIRARCAHPEDPAIKDVLTGGVTTASPGSANLVGVPGLL